MTKLRSYFMKWLNFLARKNKICRIFYDILCDIWMQGGCWQLATNNNTWNMHTIYPTQRWGHVSMFIGYILLEIYFVYIYKDDIKDVFHKCENVCESRRSWWREESFSETNFKSEAHLHYGEDEKLIGLPSCLMILHNRLALLLLVGYHLRTNNDNNNNYYYNYYY